MVTHWKKALVAVALVVFAPLSVAQAISVPGGHGGVVTGGSTISVGFADANQAGQTVRVTVSNNLPGPLHEEVYLDITLDAAGKGSVQWEVVGTWTEAVFLGGGAIEMLLFVN